MSEFHCITWAWGRTQREGVVEGRGEFDQTKVHQGRRLLAPTPLRTHELANGNVLTAKLLAEPAGLGAAFVIEIALGRAVVKSALHAKHFILCA